MRGLGYTRYGAGGGDFGSGIATFMALDDPGPLTGLYLTWNWSATRGPAPGHCRQPSAPTCTSPGSGTRPSGATPRSSPPPFGWPSVSYTYLSSLPTSPCSAPASCSIPASFRDHTSHKEQASMICRSGNPEGNPAG